MAKLSDLAEVSPSKQSPSLPPDTPFHFIPMKAVKEEFGGIDIQTMRPLSEVSKGYTQFMTGDVIMAKITPCMENGKLAIVPDLKSPWAYGSTEFHVIRPKAGVEGKWIAYFLSQMSCRRDARNKMSGSAGQLRVPTAWLEALNLPIVSTNEQRRIIAKIEELFSDLDAGVAALERVRANLKRYRAAVLHAAVTGRLTEAWRKQNPQTEAADNLLDRILKLREQRWTDHQVEKFNKAGKAPPTGWRKKYEPPPVPSSLFRNKLPPEWCYASVDQLTSGSRTSGYGVLQPGDDLPDGIPLVRVCDVAEGRVDEGNLKRIAPSISAQYERTVLQGGEILLTIVGTIGRTAIVPQSLHGANIARAVAVIPTTELVEARFIELCLRESSMRTRLTKAAHEVARKTLNLEDVRAASLPLAPVEEQRQIIEEVDRRFSVVEAVEAEVEHGIIRAARLRQSILKRAFEGKLVPQIDGEDQPMLTSKQPPLAASLRKRGKRISQPPRIKRKHRKGIAFDRCAVMSYAINRLGSGKHFGRTEAMKTLYLSEAWLGIDLELEPVREQMGPLDNAIYKIENLARKQGWFTTRKAGPMIRYEVGPKIADRLAAGKRILGDKLTEFDRLLSAIEKMDTDRAELFATTFAVWNDLLLDTQSADDAAIVAGVHGWHPSKIGKFPADRIVRCIDWMKQHHFVPKGTGPRSTVLVGNIKG